jgi:hypothetical protein
MRKAGLGLALLASAQLTLLSSPAFADNTKASTAPTEESSSTTSSGGKKSTGWVLFGVGGALTIGGIVLDIVGTTQGTVSGQGGPGDAGTTSNAKTNFYWGGTALIVAGVVTGIVGGSMIWGKHESKSDSASRPHSEDAQLDSVSKTAQAAAASAPGFTLPLVGATF